MSAQSILDQPRYKEKPALLLFELYVLDAIGKLSETKRQGIEQLDLRQMFNTTQSDWKLVVKEALKLSDTIDVAILDRWYSAREQDGAVDAEHFSRQFADEYFEDGSQVDIWPEGRLETTRAHIEQCRAQEQ